MMSFTLITSLLSIYSWISVSVSEFHTVEVQPGPDVTLLCSNFSSFPVHMHWFKLDNRPNISCISSIFSSDSNASYCEGPQHGKYTMTSNTSTIFLRIKEVELSDSGLYFCGFPSNGKPAIVSGTHLRVQETFTGITTVIYGIMGALVFVLIMAVISLAVKIKKLQTVDKVEQNPQQSENLGSDDLNYAALRFHQRAKNGRRPPAEQHLEPDDVYAVSRKTKKTSRTVAQSGAVALFD